MHWLLSGRQRFVGPSPSIRNRASNGPNNRRGTNGVAHVVHGLSQLHPGHHSFFRCRSWLQPLSRSIRRLRLSRRLLDLENWHGGDRPMKKVLALVAWFGRRAQPAALAPGNSFAGLNETEFKTSIAAAIRAAFDEGANAERSRIEAILTAPGAATFSRPSRRSGPRPSDERSSDSGP